MSASRPFRPQQIRLGTSRSDGYQAAAERNERSRRATQRNLYSVLSIVDRERPGESLLLTVPTRPHGTVKSAIFTTRETRSSSGSR